MPLRHGRARRGGDRRRQDAAHQRSQQIDGLCPRGWRLRRCRRARRANAFRLRRCVAARRFFHPVAARQHFLGRRGREQRGHRARQQPALVGPAAHRAPADDRRARHRRASSMCSPISASPRTRRFPPTMPLRIATVLVKCEPDRRGRIRGHRHTMLDDTDINAQRHIRGAVAGLVAGVIGDGRIFVSGGAEHQGPGRRRPDCGHRLARSKAAPDADRHRRRRRGRMRDGAQARRCSRDVEVVCLERVSRDDHSEAGTGLNVGPNAVKALDAIDPRTGRRASPRPVLSGATGGYRSPTARVLFDLPLANVADGPGWRIRWSELYRVLREAAGDSVSYGCEITGHRPRSGRSRARPSISWRQDGKAHRLDGIDLLIAADGRYSGVRRAISGEPAVRQTGVAIFRAAGAGHVERFDRRLRAMVQRAQPPAVVSGAARAYLCRRHVSDSTG